MFDPRDPVFLADPYPEFARLRRQGEVHAHEGLGLAIAVSHEAASAVLRHRALGRIWSDAQPAERFVSFNLLHRNSLLENEPPAHTRLRRSIAGAFGRGHVERLRPTVTALADRMVRELAERGGGDLLEHLAQPLPVAVIAELLDIPEADRSKLVPWSNAIVKMYEYGLAPDGQRAAERAATEFADFLRAITEERRRKPGVDLISDLVRSDLRNGVWALIRHPDQWRRLREDPGLLDTCVEELIPPAPRPTTTPHRGASRRSIFARRCKCSSGPRPRTWRSPVSASRRAPRSPRCSARPRDRRRAACARDAHPRTHARERTGLSVRWSAGSGAAPAPARS